MLKARTKMQGRRKRSGNNCKFAQRLVYISSLLFSSSDYIGKQEVEKLQQQLIKEKTLSMQRQEVEVSRKLEAVERSYQTNLTSAVQKEADWHGVRQSLTEDLTAAQLRVRNAEDNLVDMERRLNRELDDLRDQLATHWRNAAATEAQLREAAAQQEADAAQRERKLKDDYQHRLSDLENQLTNAVRATAAAQARFEEDKLVLSRRLEREAIDRLDAAERKLLLAEQDAKLLASKLDLDKTEQVRQAREEAVRAIAELQSKLRQSELEWADLQRRLEADHQARIDDYERRLREAENTCHDRLSKVEEEKAQCARELGAKVNKAEEEANHRLQVRTF